MEIDQDLTKGSECLQRGDFDAAYRTFVEAHRKAQDANNNLAVKLSVLSLSAVLIAKNDPLKAIGFLEKSLPRSREDFGANVLGDFYYNMGLACQMKNWAKEALYYFQLSHEEYNLVMDQFDLKADVVYRAAEMHVQLEDFANAARMYEKAFNFYTKLGDYFHALLCLVKRARYMGQCGLLKEGKEVLEKCATVCQEAPQNESLVAIYVEMGILYLESKDYNKSLLCLELALPLCQSKNYTAIVKQNMGTVYNTCNQFQSAIVQFLAAAEMFDELYVRMRQAQCLSSLAYSYSQMNRFQETASYFHQAFLIAVKINDIRLSWQCAEGIASALAAQGKGAEAQSWFEEALKLLNQAPNRVAKHRITLKMRLFENTPSHQPPLLASADQGKPGYVRRTTLQRHLEDQHYHAAAPRLGSGLLVAPHASSSFANTAESIYRTNRGFQQPEEVQLVQAASPAIQQTAAGPGQMIHPEQKSGLHLGRRATEEGKAAFSDGHSIQRRTLLHTVTSEERMKLAALQEETDGSKHEEYYRPPSRPPSEIPQPGSKKKGVFKKLKLRLTQEGSDRSNSLPEPQPLGLETRGINGHIQLTDNSTVSSRRRDDEMEDEDDEEDEDESSTHTLQGQGGSSDEGTFTEDDDDDDEDIKQQAQLYKKQLQEQDSYETAPSPSHQERKTSANRARPSHDQGLANDGHDSSDSYSEAEDESENHEEKRDRAVSDDSYSGSSYSSAPPPQPSQSPPTTSHDMSNTYEQPVSAQGENNYFRMETNPLYATIGTVRSQGPESQEPPALPSRNRPISSAEHEGSHGEEDQQLSRQKAGRKKKGQSNSSKACAVM